MVQYPKELAQALRYSSVRQTAWETQIEVKPIPDEARPGRLDPRNLADAIKRKESAVQDSKKEQTLEERRARMGFPGWNLNTVAVWTKYEEHIWNGNSVKVWIYYPRLPEGKTGRPGLVYLHGGGWIGGSPYDVEAACRLIAERAGCVVFNIDYSLAPEHKYPNGLDDCWASIRYIYENAEKWGVDPQKLGVGGDSAGGNLAAVCALKDRDLGTHYLRYCVLMYPVVTLPTGGCKGYRWSLEQYEICDEQREYIEPSLHIGRPPENGEDDPGLGSFYLKPGDSPTDPYVSPLFAEHYKGLCKTLIVTAEYDGLRLQDEFYGKLLRADGVDTRILRYKGMHHGFIEETGYVPQAEDLCQEIADDLLSL